VSKLERSRSALKARAQTRDRSATLERTRPCVTDADLLLGYLDENYFLGGEMKLDKEAAKRGVMEKIAKPLGVTFVQAIWGIMISSTRPWRLRRKRTLPKRRNPKIVTVSAFGGAGPCMLLALRRNWGPEAARPTQCRSRIRAWVLHRARAFDLVRSHKVSMADAISQP